MSNGARKKGGHFAGKARFYLRKGGKGGSENRSYTLLEKDRPTIIVMTGRRREEKTHQRKKERDQLLRRGRKKTLVGP